MKDEFLGSPAASVVQSEEAAEALANPEAQRFLAPFIGRERTVGEAAKALGVSANSLLYRVGKLESLGLLRVVRESPRPGRAIKVYRASSDAFFVPFRVTRAETLDALMADMDAHWQGVFMQNVARAIAQVGADVGVRIWRGETGEIYTKLALGPEQLLEFTHPDLPAMFALRAANLRLDPEDARELQRDLLAVYRKYEARSGRDRHMIHLAFVPWLLEDVQH